MLSRFILHRINSIYYEESPTVRTVKSQCVLFGGERTLLDRLLPLFHVCPENTRDKLRFTIFVQVLPLVHSRYRFLRGNERLST